MDNNYWQVSVVRQEIKGFTKPEILGTFVGESEEPFESASNALWDLIFDLGLAEHSSIHSLDLAFPYRLLSISDELRTASPVLDDTGLKVWKL